MNLDWAFALKDGVPQLSRQALIPGGSVEVTHENLFGDSQSLSVSLSASDWRNPAADLGFQMSYTEPFYKPNTTRNLQVRLCVCVCVKFVCVNSWCVLVMSCVRVWGQGVGWGSCGFVCDVGMR
jgi:hypothetical protein